MLTSRTMASAAPLRGTRELSSVVAGRELAGQGAMIRSTNPWTGEVLAEARALQADQLRDVVAAAHAAEQPLAQMGWAERGAVLQAAALRVRERAVELADLVAIEVGKPLAEARVEVERSAGILDFYAGAALQAKGELIPSAEPGVAIVTRRRPLGTALLITPWNFPLAIPAWKLAPAFVCGNPVIWKPASAALATAHAFLDCFELHELPTGALSLVLGPGSSIDPLLDADLAAMSFTGSSAVGQRLRDRLAARGVRVQLELGGSNTAIVLDGAGPESADMIARAAYGFAGQKCTATSVVIATPGSYSELADRLAEATRRAPWGDPLDDCVWGGPVIDEGEAGRIRAQLDGHIILAEAACEERATVVPPTLVTVEDRSSPLAREEVFGPVLTLIRAEDVDHAVDMANDTEYGLAASVFGRDTDTLQMVSNRIETGLLAINRGSTGLEVQAPSGGWKASGDGDPEQGNEALRFYTRSQTIYWKSQSDYGVFP